MVLLVLGGGHCTVCELWVVSQCAVQMCSLLAVEASFRHQNCRCETAAAAAAAAATCTPEPTLIGYLGMRDWLLQGRYFVDRHAHCV